MDWLLYLLALAILAFLGKSWTDYMDHSDRLQGEQRKLRQKIQHHQFVIEEKEKKIRQLEGRIVELARERGDLARELGNAEALLAEMVRKEKRRNLEAFMLDDVAEPDPGAR